MSRDPFVAEPDPFGAAAIRERVLAGWVAAPVRFREDANAEEDYVSGGYRDRLVVELAQNAADAAARAGVPGRLLLAMREIDGVPVLVAANTGAPLDAAGVQALATLRASAKRDGETVGRFGVGFSAVLAVSDEPALLSRAGGVRFAAADTRALVAEAAATSPGLADELARRGGHVPVLRLPFATTGTPPAGYDTAVLLPLRDAVAEDSAARMLAEADDPLLIALPGLAEIVLEGSDGRTRTIRDVDRRWHLLRRSGRLDPALLADRPTEQRSRTGWQLAWALPRDPAVTAVPAVLHAPTPSDEPLGWPALLVASLPLDTDRRHVAPGPATDALVRHAAAAYADLLEQRAAAGDPIWPLVPTGLATGVLDGALREGVARLLPGTAVLVPVPTSGRDGVLLRPRDAVALDPPAGADPAVVAALAGWLPGLVHAPPEAAAALRALDVRRVALAEVVDALPGEGETPQRWRACYAALARLADDLPGREALAGLPVPLADGRVVRGPRGLVLLTPGGPGGDLPPGRAVPAAGALALLGVRVVDPAAAHPLLERLGARSADPRSVLELPAVRAAVQASPDAEDPAAVADAVLQLVGSAVGAGTLGPGDLPWLGDLALPDEDGELAPASALALPGSDAAEVFDPAEIGPVHAELAARWGAAVLAATGVLTGPVLLRADEVLLDGDDEHELDGWSGWAALAGDGEPDAVVSELVAVRDLDAVADAGWPRALELIAADRALRSAVLAPARVRRNGRVLDVPPYTAWWLRQHLLGRNGPVLDADAAAELQPLLPTVPDWLARLDPALRRALGVAREVTDLDARGVAVLLERIADPELTMTAAAVLRLTSGLARLGPLDVEPPARIRVPDGAGSRVLPARDAVVLDAPMYMQRPDLGAGLPVPAGLAPALADLLDLPLASEIAPGVVDDGDGAPSPVPALPAQLLPAGPAQWCEHERLRVDGVEVDWWVDGTGPGAVVHAGTVQGLARGLAWASAQWGRRAAIAELLSSPQPADPGAVIADEWFG